MSWKTFSSRWRAFSLGLAIGCSPALVHGESIWQRHNPQHGYLFQDTKARVQGDLLTVLILQDSAVDHREDRGLKKSSGIKSIFEMAAQAGAGFGPHAANTALDAAGDSGREFQGEESFSSQQALTDRVTVTVMDVLPNGNLLLSGSRRIMISGEERNLILTGIARPIDIGPDNTISSRFVADLVITYEATGASQKFTRQGWLDRGMNLVWPF